MKIEIGILLSDFVLETKRFEIMSVAMLLFTIISTIISILGIYENSMKVIERFIVLHHHHKQDKSRKLNQYSFVEEEPESLTVPDDKTEAWTRR